MILQNVKTAVTSRAGRTVLIGRKHSPEIMFVGGVAGVVVSTVLACRATLKLEEIVAETEEKIEKINSFEHIAYKEKDRQNDLRLVRVQTVAKIAKAYAPAFGVGVLSVAAITGSHVVLTRRNVALTAAYSALDKGFNEYRARVRQELGEDKEKEFRYGPLREVDAVEVDEGGNLVKKQLLVHDGGASIYARYFDESCSSWSKVPSYNQMFLQCQQNFANDLLRGRGHVFLNEVYDMLGIPRSKEGAVVGWVKGNGDDFVDFGIWNGNMFDAQRWVNGEERSILLDFNVDGVIYDLI